MNFPGGVIEFLKTGLGGNSTVLHHAAWAGWVEGVELIIQLARTEYGELVLMRDGAGRRPVDVTYNERIAARLAELTLHAERAEKKRVKETEMTCMKGLGALALVALVVVSVYRVLTRQD